MSCVFLHTGQIFKNLDINVIIRMLLLFHLLVFG